ncbi:hypothetical protein F8M41_002976 [Gigaspora margarita]|uniref:Uncharacterized protein n=1 Tax=Gigaspora margarita TaxID=4874 RepID=A0A8H3XDG9_GIGMA|nr:hypothetical protein F8M41_002976 [Gigaspora margarita]
MSLFLVTSKFNKNISQLHKQIKDFSITKIRITNDSIMCYDHEGKPVFFLFSQDITTNSLEDAWISLYLENLRRTDIFTRPFEEVNGKTWKDQITDIRNKMRQSQLDQVSLLQYYLGIGTV